MNRLREIRFFKIMNQYELANSSHVHQSRISLIENGYVKPRPDERVRLAKALHVSPEEIWGENGNR
jgi:transcriptional regulator with XRE-family HTH domain